MAYAMIFIPITTASVVFCGRFITAVIKYFITTFESKVLKRNKIVRFQRKVISIEIILNTLLIPSLALAYHMTHLRNHDFFEAFYFTFISLTTIGFGDTEFDLKYHQDLSIAEFWIFLIVDWLFFFVSYSMLASLIGTIVSAGTEGPNKKTDNTSSSSDESECLNSPKV